MRTGAVAFFLFFSHQTHALTLFSLSVSLTHAYPTQTQANVPAGTPVVAPQVSIFLERRNARKNQGGKNKTSPVLSRRLFG